ncbi:MAG: hypothetical protein EA357_08715 [Micavibrio sp.]|jgi:hypothetical protein|nr:MAG: hypothetical protein EA357_08715 [Micavibrio sp.]
MDKRKKSGAVKKDWKVRFRTFLFGATVLLLSFALIAAPHVMRSQQVVQNMAYAQTPPSPSSCPYWIPCCGCVVIGQTAIVTAAITFAKEIITGFVYDYIENFTNDMINDLVGGIFDRLQLMEDNFETWWGQFYLFDLRPALASMMAQLHTSRMDQTRMLLSFMDAPNLNIVTESLEGWESTAQRDYRPSTQVCMAITQSGGFARSYAFERAVRRGLEGERAGNALNTQGSLAAEGPNVLIGDRWDRLSTRFCNPAFNKGEIFGAPCTPAPGQFDAVDADIKPTEIILESMTIPISDPNARIATEQLIENIAGNALIPGIKEEELVSLTGQEVFLFGRGEVARASAAASVPLLSVSWRTEGSDMGDWVREFSDLTGSSLPISDNPSYYELMHALTHYKSSTGTYALEMIDTPLNIERERYIVSSIYLMNLRDYFELLERVALTLAVETGNMLDRYMGDMDTGISMMTQ